MSEPTEQQIEAVAWKRALDCAARQFENYYRADMLADPAQRRVALDDALQHAVGILSLAAAPRQAEGWQPGDRRCVECDSGLEPEWVYCPFCAKLGGRLSGEASK